MAEGDRVEQTRRFGPAYSLQLNIEPISLCGFKTAVFSKKRIRSPGVKMANGLIVSSDQDKELVAGVGFEPTTFRL